VRIHILLAFVCLAACRSHQDLVAVGPCPSAWHRDWHSDSTFSICMPASIAQDPGGYWARRTEGSPIALDFLSITVLSWPADSLSPPELTSGPDCLLHCSVGDSMVVDKHRIGPFDARTQSGLVTGSFAGWSRKPAIV
jgi:hypothetical protein